MTTFNSGDIQEKLILIQQCITKLKKDHPGPNDNMGEYRDAVEAYIMNVICTCSIFLGKICPKLTLDFTIIWLLVQDIEIIQQIWSMIREMHYMPCTTHVVMQRTMGTGTSNIQRKLELIVQCFDKLKSSVKYEYFTTIEEKQYKL